MVVKKNKGIGNISHLQYDEQEYAITNYIDSLLFGELRDHLDEHKTKLFKGISREFTKKYMLNFNEMLKINNNRIGPINDPVIIKYNDEDAEEYVGFFVFQEGRGNAFGSFPTAYKFANETYMYNHMILGNATKQLGLNTQVSFGRVVVQDGKMVEKDLEKVVNNDFYKVLIS